MAGSLPPSSSVIRLRFPDADSMILRPVAVDPVKLIFLMSECRVIQAPRSLPPETMLSTPAGSMLLINSPSFRVQSGVLGEGFSTMVFPATSAGAIFQTASNIGKFHGVIPPTTPRGVRRTSTLRPSPWSSIWGTSSCEAISRHQIAAPPTSHSAPARALPCSQVSKRINSSAFASIASPMDAINDCRSETGRRDQEAKAAFAPATACSSCSRLASGAAAITSSVAGLTTSICSVAPTSCPLIVIR